MPYTIESKSACIITERTGFLGLSKKDRPDIKTTPLGELNEGEKMQLISPIGKKKWGLARLENGILFVRPEGDIVVDFGDVTDYKPYIQSGPEKTSWTTITVKTERDLIIRTRDYRESIHFRRKIIS